MPASDRPVHATARPAAEAPRHRSGAVARMLQMPVATLRVWERRYRLTNAALSAGGQRLYADEDVRRLVLIKQLNDLGHAIGRLAGLDIAQLRAVASTHAQTLVETGRRSEPVSDPDGAAAWRLVVVGRALGVRLRRPALLQQIGRPLELLGPFDDVEQAAASVAARPSQPRPDAWLVQVAQLHADWWTDFQTAAAGAHLGASAASRVAVLHGFASEAACDALAAQGVALLREPQPDVALGQWLRLWAGTATGAASAPAQRPLDARVAPGTRPRWDDAALTDFAALSTTVACECPRHVAELLVQLSRFEAYSAQCLHRNPADAALHAYLGQVAASARADFEAALERVAQHEGLLLPPSAG